MNLKQVFFGLFFLMSLSFWQALKAQCPSGNLVFTSQNQVDEFLINYPNCTSFPNTISILTNNSITNLDGLENIISIGGTFRIQDSDLLPNLNSLENLTSVGIGVEIYNNDLFVNLNGLENLTSIEGYLSIYQNDFLTNLNGLENITSLGGKLRITDNDILTNLNGLENLTLIGGDLRISNNGLLASLEGLESVTSIGGDFWIYGSSLLTNFNGLGNLTSIGGYLKIQSNSLLTNLNGLENLTSVGEYFNISYNQLLSTLTGVENLISIGGSLGINQNELLTNLAGFDNLYSIGQNLSIDGNSALSSLAGLENLSSIGQNLYITDNENLSLCSMPVICEFLVNGNGTTNILNNVSGCNNTSEIIDNCTGIGKIHFPLFYDLNENGFQDNQEPFLTQTSVVIEPGSYIGYSNQTNGGVKYLYHGDYSISYNQSATPLWELTTNSASYNFTLDYNNASDTVFFGFYPIENISTVKASLVNGLTRCNEFVIFDALAINDGSTIADGTLWLTIDENILDVNYIDPPDTLVTPNRYGWHFTSLFPGQVVKKQISLQLPGPPDFPIGDFLYFNTEVNYSDINSSNGYDKTTHRVEVECSYDPNDKLMQPIYPDNYALTTEDLIYTIRFQNTGNAEAYDVVIKDLLSSNLDRSTFKYITSSHESVLSTFLDGNLLTFEFKDIFLPDSTTNFDESQGYIMYSIRAKEDVEDYTIIENTAQIFFDLNPAVHTNTTENVMLYTFDFDEDGYEIWIDCDDENPAINPNADEIPNNGIDEDCDGEDGAVAVHSFENIIPKVFPNPTSSLLQIVFPVAIEGAYELRDFSGKFIQQGLLAKETTINMERQANGVYILLMKTEEGVWTEFVVKSL